MPVLLSIRYKFFGVKLGYPFNETQVAKIRSIPGRKWNFQEKIWEIPFSYENWLLIHSHFEQISYCPLSAVYPLKMQLKLKNYSQDTMRAYTRHLQTFFQITGLQPVNVKQSNVLAYIDNVQKEKNPAIATLRQMVQAFQYYFTNIIQTDFALKIPLPKKEKRLPAILAEQEILQLIVTPKNPKHQLLLKLAYSSGLRVSELVSLQWRDIDTTRGMLRIRQGKGKKDRNTILPKKMQDWIEEYRKSQLYYKENAFLFPGQWGQNHLHIRTAQKIFEMAVLTAGIKKKVTIHSLRHAFATHMLEQGTDIRYIQYLLGHKSLKTTQIYTHVAKTTIENLRSPIDRILE